MAGFFIDKRQIADRIKTLGDSMNLCKKYLTKLKLVKF